MSSATATISQAYIIQENTGWTGIYCIYQHPPTGHLPLVSLQTSPFRTPVGRCCYISSISESIFINAPHQLGLGVTLQLGTQWNQAEPGSPGSWCDQKKKHQVLTGRSGPKPLESVESGSTEVLEVLRSISHQRLTLVGFALFVFQQLSSKIRHPCSHVGEFGVPNNGPMCSV